MTSAQVEGILKAYGLGQVVGRHQFFYVPHDQVHNKALGPAEHLAKRGDNHIAHGCFMNHFFKSVRKVFNNDNGGRTGVNQLVLKLARGIQRVAVHHHAACAQGAHKGNGILQQVGHHQCNAITSSKTQRLKPACKGLGHVVQFAIAYGLAHADVGRLVGELGKGLVNEMAERRN